MSARMCVGRRQPLVIVNVIFGSKDSNDRAQLLKENDAT